MLRGLFNQQLAVNSWHSVLLVTKFTIDH